jgi:hypothetical protein
MQNTPSVENVPANERALLRWSGVGFLLLNRLVGTVVEAIKAGDEEKATQAIAAIAESSAQGAAGIDAFLSGEEVKVHPAFLEEPEVLKVPEGAYLMPSNGSVN